MASKSPFPIHANPITSPQSGKKKIPLICCIVGHCKRNFLHISKKPVLS